MIIFEDEHLLVINKPPGWNTHSPSPYAGQGVYEWLKTREPRWSCLALLHRLDKETSGLMVFGKTPEANRSLTAQFEQRLVKKKYALLTDRPPPATTVKVQSALMRVGDHYMSRPLLQGCEVAETVFHPGVKDPQRNVWVVEAEPATGRTHQIRVHAAAEGFPILGDTLYGGTPSERVYLHAQTLGFNHLVTQTPLLFTVLPEFSADSRQRVRNAIIDSSATNAYRLIHGAADHWPGLYLDRLGDYLLAQSIHPLTSAQQSFVQQCAQSYNARGIYHKILQHPAKGAPQLIWGDPAPAEIFIRENGLQFSLRFDEGYSVGLFLDQRENRRRLITHYIGPGITLPPNAEVLNTFAYTCGFSMCAAQSGAHVTSLDLSKKYLEWGKHNFTVNNLDPSAHEFIFGDAFDWMRRLAKKQRLFDLILLDPPTFSRSKEHGIFQAEKNYGELITAALPLLKPGGILFASTNAANLEPEKFLEMITAAITRAHHLIKSQQYIPQPPDFPIHRQEPAYLKTAWFQIR